MANYERPGQLPSGGGGRRGQGTLVLIDWIDEEQGLARVKRYGGGGSPDNSLPGIDDGDRPDQGLPGGGGRPGHLPARPGGPGRPVDPGYGRPGAGWGGRPTDPDYGIDEGAGPGHLPSRPGVWPRPPHPGQGLPGRPEIPPHPDHRPPWHKPSLPEGMWPPGPTDPDWGIDAPIDTPDHPAHLPSPGETPDNTLPPVDGHHPPTDLPPGTIWPPLPPDAPVGKHAFLIWISGVGLRYGVFDVPEHPPVDPDHGVDSGEHPDQGGPERPARPGTGLPPAPGQGLPGGAPARPGQPAPGQPLPRPPIASTPPRPQPK